MMNHPQLHDVGGDRIYITYYSSEVFKITYTQHASGLTLISSTVSIPLMSIRLFATTALFISKAVSTVGNSG